MSAAIRSPFTLFNNIFLLCFSNPAPNVPIIIGRTIMNINFPIRVSEYFSKNNTTVITNNQVVNVIKCSAIGVPVSPGIAVIVADMPVVKADNFKTPDSSLSIEAIVFSYLFGVPAVFNP